MHGPYAQPPDSSWCQPEPNTSPSCSTSQKCCRTSLAVKENTGPNRVSTTSSSDDGRLCRRR